MELVFRMTFGIEAIIKKAFKLNFVHVWFNFKDLFNEVSLCLLPSFLISCKIFFENIHLRCNSDNSNRFWSFTIKCGFIRLNRAESHQLNKTQTQSRQLEGFSFHLFKQNFGCFFELSVVIEHNRSPISSMHVWAVVLVTFCMRLIRVHKVEKPLKHNFNQIENGRQLRPRRRLSTHLWVVGSMPLLYQETECL